MSDKNSLTPTVLLEGLVDILKNNGERLNEGDFGGGGYPQTPRYEVGDLVLVKHYQGVGKIAYIKHREDVGVIIKEPSLQHIVTTIDDLRPYKHNKIKKECGEPDQMTDEELSMFSRHNVGTRRGRGQGDNPWNHLKKRGRGFSGRTKKDVREEGGMEECAGVGIVDKQNSTCDVGPNTLKKNLAAFNLEEAVKDMFNAMVREGKINPHSPQYTEFLNETDIHANPNQIPKDQTSAFKGAISMPGISQNKANGSSYTQYRFGIALAGAPEFPTQAAGAFAGDPLLATYTDEELEIVNAAAKMVGAGEMKKLGSNRSTELDNTNTKSAIGQAKKNKYGV